MSPNLYFPKRPKQARSIRRYEKVLDATEKILNDQGIHAVSLKEVAKTANLKRPSLYKFFPNTLSLLYALSERHIEKIIKLFRRNTLETKQMSIEWNINLFIDLLSIHLNHNKTAASLIFSLNEIPKSLSINNQNHRLLATTLLERLKLQNLVISQYKIFISTQIALAVMSVGYREEEYISPNFINEAKRAVLSYILTPE